ncbi:MAG: TonB-dependent receptor [Casimicrobiaceae bacterium]|nr:TonB-dependent receptor [Casimicrobiaceae bacterium]MDW8313036.1 TonB-dependent receptor [Burkholderiales bacterium]
MNQLKPIALAVATALAAGSALAQEAQRVERIEITGTNIKRIDAEGPLPVVIIKREDIENSGKTTVNDILSTLTVVSGGSFSEATNAGNTFAPGTASVSLRGLGVNTTLVLLNGRRVANYGFAQNINENFVDLNSIPLSAIERIEVLKDGASAIYGSDAIAGVINIILRRDFRGVEVAGLLADTKDGGAGEIQAALTGGFGNLARDRFNVMATVSYYKRDRLNALERSFSATADQRGRGPGGSDNRSPTGNPGSWGVPWQPFANCPANLIVPAASLGVGGGGNLCAYDFAGANDLLPKTERIGAFASASFSLSPNWTAFAELMFNSNTTNTSAAPTPASFNVVGHPQRPSSSVTTVAYRFLEAGNRLNELETDTSRVVAGVKGTTAGWDLEAAVNFGRSKTVNTGFNYIIQERAAEAFAGTLAGFAGQRYNVLNPSANPPGMLEAIKISPVRTGVSKVEGGDIKASRELFNMAGGAAAIAAGYEYRKENVRDDPDPRVALTNPNRVTVAGSGGTAVRGGRTINSAYAELSLPFLKGVESQLAIRMDRYSDFGTATTPKVSLSWRPNTMILARGGYAEGFRAPSLAELYLGESTSFPQVRDTPRCNDYIRGLGASDPRTQAVCGPTGTGNVAQVRSIFLGNPNLDAEKSKSFSLGLVLEPHRDLSVAVDYYNIEHKNRILAPTASFILANEDLFPGAVRRQPRTADDIAANARGALRGIAGDLEPGIVRTFFNASEQKTSGIDIDLRTNFSLGAWGKLEVSNVYTYMISLKRQINPGQPLTELVDTFNFPRWRHVLSATWSRGAWGATVSANTVAGTEDLFSVSGSFPRIGNHLTFDAQVRYTGIKDLTLALGGRNVTNRKPPFSNESWYGYAPGMHDPRGAFYYISMRYKFR